MTLQQVGSHPVTGAAVDTAGLGAWSLGMIDTAIRSPWQGAVIAAIGLIIMAWRAFRAAQREEQAADDATWRGKWYLEHSRLEQVMEDAANLAKQVSDLSTELAAMRASLAELERFRCPFAGASARCDGRTPEDGPLPVQAGERWAK
jgi:hypothetical protein